MLVVIVDNISSDDLDHLITLSLMGNDGITSQYLASLGEKYGAALPEGLNHTGGNQVADPMPALPGFSFPDDPAGNQLPGYGEGTDLSAGNGQLPGYSTPEMPDTSILPGGSDVDLGFNPNIQASAEDGSGKGGSVINDFFEGSKYTEKVLSQIKTGDLHAFPESVKTFQGSGEVTKIIGGDGITRDMLRISGEYRGKKGVFEFIKEPDGSINHRLFRPISGE